jgi:hypothetical protein
MWVYFIEPWDYELKETTNDSMALKEFVFSLYPTSLNLAQVRDLVGRLTVILAMTFLGI